MRRPARRRDQLLGIAFTALLALVAVAGLVAALVGLGLFVVAMPLTTAAVGAVAGWAAWRVVKQRRRAHR
jgi:hypothetical protein